MMKMNVILSGITMMKWYMHLESKILFQNKFILMLLMKQI